MKNNLLSFAMLAALAFSLTLTACGPSAATLAIQQTATIDELDSLQNKLIWLQANAQSGKTYVIEVNANEKDLSCGGLLLSSCRRLSYKGKSDVTLVFRGIGGNRIIQQDFSVDAGVTLVLDDNITITSVTTIVGKASGSVITVYKGGTLIMNDGSAIGGGKEVEGEGGAGVYVKAGGTFNMKGGTIYNNTVHPDIQLIQTKKRSEALGKAMGASLVGAAANKTGNSSMANKAAADYNQAANDYNYGDIVLHGGGGVYVDEKGIFTKTGGTIIGYSSDPQNGNVVKDPSGKPIDGQGHAIYFKNKKIDTTVGPEITLEFKDGVLKEGRTEAVPVAAETASEQPVAPAEAVAPVAQQAAPLTPQEAAQEYQATSQKIQARQQAAVLEYQTAVQKNPAAQQEALQKYQKTIQETQLEAQEAAKKYQEAMQRK